MTTNAVTSGAVPDRAQVVIVGGGVTGCSIAYHLAHLGWTDGMLAGGEWAGYVRAAAYGYTVGGPVGLAQVACEDGVTGQWLKGGDFRVRTPDGEIPARLQIAPPYDPQRLRILDR